MSKQPSLPYLYNVFIITQALHNENTNKPHDYIIQCSKSGIGVTFSSLNCLTAQIQ